MSTIIEPARDLAVQGSVDVLVAGGGIAGVAAAVAAAREGASVCLIEKACGLGGLATLGNVTIWLPICDGRGRQVIGGLGEELLRLSVADLPRDYPSARMHGIPACWLPGGDPEARRKTRYRVEFNPWSYTLALERLVLDAGVTLLYDTRLGAVRQEDDRVSHVIVENKSGRFALGCRTVIDATGDADVCFLAGESTESVDANVLCGWFYTLKDGALTLHQLSNKYCRNVTKENAQGPFFRGDDGAQVTAHVVQTRALVRDRLAKLRAQAPESDVQLVGPAMMACLRMTRRLVGDFSLGEGHMHQWFEDAVGLSGDWRRSGPVYAIPYRALCGVRNRNLLAAGRCMSVDTTAWDVMRAIPGCSVTGQAAGVAAALAVRSGEADVRGLSVPALQAALRAQGVLLAPELAAAG